MPRKLKPQANESVLPKDRSTSRDDNTKHEFKEYKIVLKDAQKILETESKVIDVLKQRLEFLTLQLRDAQDKRQLHEIEKTNITITNIKGNLILAQQKADEALSKISASIVQINKLGITLTKNKPEAHIRLKNLNATFLKSENIYYDPTIMKSHVAKMMRSNLDEIIEHVDHLLSA
jgi:hypothetical protein